MIRDFDESIAYLERLVATPVRNEPGAGLERARLILAHLGNPQDRVATLHITGSSGKGSTAAMAAAILRAAGYRTGTFASPHLEDYTERIALDGVPISRREWTRLLNRLRPLIEEMSAGALPGYTLGRPALLQVLWPLAALYFAERGADIAVVEVGMGGRYDSTRASNARVAVITNVSLEHTQQLGPGIAEIAYHKAGVARPGGILVTAAQDPQALEVIAAECAQQGTALWRVTPLDGPTGAQAVSHIGAGVDRHAGAEAASDIVVGEVRYAADEASLRVATPIRRYTGLRPGLHGSHQRANAACAVAAIDALGHLGVAQADAVAVRDGLSAARLPGRLERIAGDPETVLDGAHNPDAARALAAVLRELYPSRRVVLLLGILGDKDIATMVDALAPLALAVVVAEPPWEGRMGRGPDVARHAKRHLRDVALVPDIPAALAAAQRRARDLGAPLVVAGSLILVGAVRPLLRKPIKPSAVSPAGGKPRFKPRLGRRSAGSKLKAGS